MPQTIQLVRGSASISFNNSNGGEVNLFTVPSCTACRVITSGLSITMTSGSTTNHRCMVVQTGIDGYRSPLAFFPSNAYTGAIDLVTSDDGNGFANVNGSIYGNNLYAVAGNSTSFSQASNNYVTGPGNGSGIRMPRNFWLGPNDVVSMRWAANGSTSGTVYYSFILALNT